MRIVMVSAHYQLLDGRVFHREARTLRKAGHEVVVVHWDRARDGGVERGTHEGVRTVSLPIQVSRGSLLSKALQYRGIRKRLAAAVIQERPDAVHCHDLETLPIGLDVKKALGVPLVYDAHEDYPAMVAQTNRVAAKAFARLEARSLTKVDRVITVNDLLKAKYAARRPTTVVANFPDLSLYASIKPRPETGGAGGVTVLYVGGISRTRGIVELLDALRLLGTKAPRAVILGKTLDDLDVMNEAEKRGVDALVSAPPEVPFPEVPRFFEKADIGYAVLNGTRSNAQATPVKMLEYMAAGLPVLANGDFPIPSSILRRWKCGLAVKWCEAGQIAEALGTLVADGERRREMGRQGRAAVKSEYNWEREAEKLVSLYRRLAGS